MLRRSVKIAWFERGRYALTLAAITFGVAVVVGTLTLTGSLEGRGDLVAEAPPTARSSSEPRYPGLPRNHS